MKDFFEKVRGWFRGILDFLKETRKELNNVSWPGRREVTGTTLVVIVAVFFFGFFLFVADVIVQFGMNHLFRAFAAQP
jgi:preprotein translocase SecE subunit